MEIVLLTEVRNQQKVREILLKDDIVSRASIVFKDGKNLMNKDGYIIYISGTDEQCERAKEITKDLAKILEEKDKDEVIKKIKEEENKANIGFGNIFG
jgi:nitrogen regulatory protein PII